MTYRSILRTRAIYDAIGLGAIGLVAWLLAAGVDAFEFLDAYARRHEDWELDEALLALVIAGLIGFVYAVRRALDLLAEVRRRQSAESDVAWIARHDTLTELPNRRFLDSFAADFDAGAPADRRKAFAVFAIDLDGFKKVNDLHGHGGGDKLLVEVARRLGALAPDELVFRLGGDEFLIVARQDSLGDPEVFARSIVETLTRPLNVSGLHAEVGASVGIARYPSHSLNLTEVVRYADLAMYEAKRARRNGVRAFTPEMNDAVTVRAETEVALRRALRNDEIRPHYQPLVDLETGQTTGFEALARWTLDNGEEIPPFTFVQFAEDFGLIIELSERLLQRACRDAVQWPADISLSFNISPTQLTDELLGLRIVRILCEAGLPAQRLEIEITETALIRHFETAERILGDLREAGIRIALDDFGSGYSSLSQLARLKVDKIKIDRSFIIDVDRNERTSTVVRAVVALGNGLGIPTTAEGVEGAEQLAWLKELGCKSAQGYLFGKAMPADRIAEFLGRAPQREAGKARA